MNWLHHSVEVLISKKFGTVWAPVVVNGLTPIAFCIPEVSIWQLDFVQTQLNTATFLRPSIKLVYQCIIACGEMIIDVNLIINFVPNIWGCDYISNMRCGNHTLFALLYIDILFVLLRRLCVTVCFIFHFTGNLL